MTDTIENGGSSTLVCTLCMTMFLKRLWGLTHFFLIFRYLDLDCSSSSSSYSSSSSSSSTGVIVILNAFVGWRDADAVDVTSCGFQVEDAVQPTDVASCEGRSRCLISLEEQVRSKGSRLLRRKKQMSHLLGGAGEKQRKSPPMKEEADAVSP